jgi:superfamily II DNA/RNA helicase
MTATLTTESLETLGTFFGPPEEINVFASVQLRPEPDYFMALCRDRHEQQERVLETLCHGPRPAILYATEKKHADDWWRLLRESGWLRVARIHGDNPPNDRNRAIEAWRGNELDIMVATSAFGLGMDKGDVRLVLHACVPETVDRFYQEVGRGGRDGNASASVLLWTQEDIRTAKSLTFPRVITEDLGLKRWKNIWYASKWSDSILLAYLRALHEELDWDTDRNMSWNLKTILLLARAGAVEVHYRPPPDQDLEDGEDPEAADSEREKEPERYYSEIPLRLNRSDTLEEAFWQEAVAKSRDATMEAANTGWRRMEDILENRRSLVDVLREVYQIRSSHVWIDPDSNEPICPPKPCATVSVIPCSASSPTLDQRWSLSPIL